MQSLIETLIAILRVESITGNERELCDLVEQRMLKIQREQPQSHLVSKRLGNALVVNGAQHQGRPLIALAGHLDTVKGDAFGAKVRQEGDKIVGLGASDMKAGVAVMLQLLEHGILERSPFNLVFVFYDGEEGPDEHNGIYTVFEQCPLVKQADLALVLEPTDNTLQLGCMGSIHARITFRGKRAHSARPWQGQNAIYLAQPFLTKLAQTAPNKKLIGGLEFVEVMTLTQAHSGDTSRNVVPDTFELNLNMRFCPGDDIAYAKRRVLDLVQGEATVEFIDQAGSASVASDNQWLQDLQKRFDLPLRPKQAYTDVAVFDTHGVPALNFGPGLTSQAHQTGEYVLVTDLIRSYQMFFDFLGQKAR